MKRILFLLFLIFLLFNLTKLESNALLLGEETTEQKLLYGVWIIEKVALVSQEYQGAHYSISRLVDLYDRESEEAKAYVGMEIEYGRNYIRLGEESYTNPTYCMSVADIFEYGENRSFIEPKLYEYLAQEKVYVSGEENYSYGRVPAACFDINVPGIEEDSLIYSGLHGMILNEDYLLIGNQGITFLAVRKNKELCFSYQDFLYGQMNQNVITQNLTEWYTQELEEKIAAYVSDLEGTEISGKMEKKNSLPPILWQDIQKLILILKEEGPYKGWNTEKRIVESSGSYPEKIKRMGAKELLLLLQEEVNESSGYEGYSSYSIQYGEKNYYLFVDYKSKHIVFMEKENESYFFISDFQVRDPACAAIIPYGGELYFLNPVKNQNIQEYDGLEICKLGIQSQSEHMMVRYIPDEYQWEKLYLTHGQHENEEILESYLKSIREALTASETIERGQEQNIRLFIGEEKESEEITLDEEINQFSMEYFGTKLYAIDLANVGEPVYIKRNIIMSDSYYAPTRMRVLAYSSINGQGEKVLSELYLDDGRLEQQPITLTQLWFKELNGKVYTFSLYYISEYTYLLNVTLTEKGEVGRIRTQLLAPKRGFVVME